MSITNIKTEHYSVPLPVVLSDSMHGDMASFELMTIRMENSNGMEGLGYTYQCYRIQIHRSIEYQC